MLATETLHPPLAFAPPAPPVSEPVTQLACIFPEIEKEVLADLLAFHDGRIEAVVATLLDTAASAQEDVDTRVAVAAQLEMDDQLARVIQQELQKEMREERKQSELGPRAAAAATATAAALKKRLQLLSSSLPERKKKERSTRLLDSDSASEAHENFAPLYSSPLQAAYTPPVMAAPSVTPLAADRYESRVSRAREANHRRSQARSSTRDGSPAPVPAYIETAADHSTAAVAVAVAVPEGELI